MLTTKRPFFKLFKTDTERDELNKNKFILDPDVHKKIFFIGIGGISMSGLAETLFKKGFAVSGSDANDSDTLSRLNKLGIEARVGHDGARVAGASLVVYTAAVGDENPELAAARRHGIPAIGRAELLGLMMENYKYPVAVAGTHGKTSTSAMITEIMLCAGLDPSAALGGTLRSIGGTNRTGGSEYFVVEACEYRDSFLQFAPFIGVILNIEEEHLDYFRDIEHITDSFLRYARNISPDGALIINSSIDSLPHFKSEPGRSVITFGGDGADWRAGGVTDGENGFPRFTLIRGGAEVSRVQLKVPGLHSVSNALAAAAACSFAGVNIPDITSALENFTGAGRRFEFIGMMNGAYVYDDYAHHPTEIKNALAAVKNLKFNKIICAFQPHNYSRTAAHFDDFVKAFGDADELLLLDIYSVREENIYGVNSRDLAAAIAKSGKKARWFEDFERACEYLYEICSAGDLVITVGAGDIYKLAGMLVNRRPF